MKSLNNEKKLIVVDATASLSGGRVYLENLLKYFAEKSCNFRFVVYYAADFDIADLAIGSADFTYYRAINPFFLYKHWLIGSILKLLWRTFILPFCLWREKPDIFFSNAGQVPQWGMGRGKAVVALHNSIPYLPDLWKEERFGPRRWRISLLHRLARDLVRRNPHFIVFSEDLKMRVIGMGASTDDCSVIYHGIEWGEIEREGHTDMAYIKSLGIRVPYLLYVSQLHRYKNVVTLLEAFARLCGEYHGISLVIVGSIADRSYGLEIDRTIRMLNLLESARVVPGVGRNDLLGIYREALGVVYPSLAENCPFALLESMAMGKPIAASRIGAIEEICGDAAIYFDPHRPEEIVTAMRRLVEDESLRSDLSLRAIARARQFSWEETARRTLEVFERVARQS